MFKKMTSTILAAATGITLAMAGSAFAVDKVKIVVGGGAPFWDTNMIALAIKNGLFADAGIEPELLSARGGGDILRVLLASEADLAAGVGVLSILAANEAGAPIKIIGNEMNTPYDLRWYVKGDSPINSLKDMAGKTLAYSSPGSSTNMVGLSLRQTLIDDGLEPLELVSTGGFSDTMTAILSGQVDAGFTALPFLHDKVLKGEIKYAIAGSDAKGFNGVTTRAYVANQKFLDERRDLAVKIMNIVQTTIDWAYANPEEAKGLLAAGLKIDMANMPAIENEIPPAALNLSNLGGMDKSVATALEHDFISKDLTGDDLAALIDMSVVADASK